jgi:hypothetical protein
MKYELDSSCLYPYTFNIQSQDNPHTIRELLHWLSVNFGRLDNFDLMTNDWGFEFGTIFVKDKTIAMMVKLKFGEIIR